MRYFAKDRGNRILESLKSCAAEVRQTGAGQWSFTLGNGKSFGVTACCAGEWLALDAPLTDRVQREQLWDFLRTGASLGGACKLVLTADRSAHIRAEIPLLAEDEFDGIYGQPDDDIPSRLLEASEAMAAAFHAFVSDNAARRSVKPQTGRDQEEIAAPEFERRLVESGWPSVERAGGSRMVDLESRSGFYQAVVERQGPRVRASVELLRSEALAEMSRAALAALLLKTAGAIRMVRPFLQEQDGHAGAGLEVSFGALPPPLEISQGLSCLSIACTMCAQEAQALQDEVIAREYLDTAVASAHGLGRKNAMLMAAD